jgi:hypothetical protein
MARVESGKNSAVDGKSPKRHNCERLRMTCKPKAQGDDEGGECESYVYAVAYIGNNLL